MSKPEKFLYVCVHERPQGHPRGSCGQKGSREVVMALATECDKQGAFGRASLVQTACMGLCNEGPMAAVFPDNVFYRDLTPADAPTLVKEHLLEGKALSKKVIPDRDW
ncbi:MAG TPA: ferredoxin [Deltaproteobacteria bacterium]|nr:MAG: hypothetical protein A2Z79_03390 [Deltaproteobacteria bacterium GWA2_55_82]OGQ62323.1 MAG: hypothetical protein A3I81_05300 [Deltaproteobacteria bacterium RIFCSPLOWO2_02_FULL_55_12]OIJ74436.1 MAG: hypothetical protein A2V21_309290 [Deltaproteobacteria bacterium GWC2_55_46]HBG47089.1 ferredoxin [Deltaproteobacteria bacterium]HCY10852.1 ferredoxin [Deltaproteobacteria bacterium]